MFVEAEIAGRSGAGRRVPRTAMRDDDTVMDRDQADNRIEFRDVEVFRAERERVLISGGVEAGERVCVSTLEAAVERHGGARPRR